MPRDSITLKGFDDVKKTLETLAPRHASNIARTAVHGVASEIASESKKNAPKDQGVLRRAIKSKRRRSPSYNPTSDVIVTKGNGAKDDAWYWHFLEFGTVKMRERPIFKNIYHYFIVKIEEVFTRQFADKLIKKLAREAKKNV